MNPIGSWRRLAFLAALSAAAAGCAVWNLPLPQEPGLHPQLTPYSYLEEGRLVSFLVDTEAARRREDRPLVPLAVGVANIGLDHLTLTRESFTLVDDAGRRYAMAGVDEVRRGGPLPSYDRRLSAHAEGAFTGRFPFWPAVPAAFFPGVEEGLADSRVQLPQRSKMFTLLYFPHPAGRWLGRRYELWLDAAELEEPVFVKFAVR
ncbi:MAG: hypothetical protein D6718_05830 [Acidobacteria bacterium]|nr:MAG: hypothetical protein D6718_05830 [Acidobacteriota bacterium]